jgi:zinc protease
MAPCLCITLLLGLSGALPPLPQAPGFPLPLEASRLSNGLQLYVVPRPGTGVLAYYTLIRVGSRDEAEPGRSGLAHLLEHLMFRGTPQWPRARYAEALRHLGGRDNATTREDHTVLEVVARADALEALVPMEADRLRNVAFTPADLAAEARAVLGEYNTTASSPDAAAYAALLRTAFTQHSYRHDVLGTPEDMGGMAGATVAARTFHRRFYTPDNVALVVVGDVDVARVQAAVEAAYGSWQGRAAVARIPREPPQQVARTVTVPWKQPARERLLMGWRMPAATPENARLHAAADVVRAAMFGRTSALHQDLVRTRGLVEGMSSSAEPHRDGHLFTLDMTLQEGADAEEVTAAVDEALQTAREAGVEPTLLEQVRTRRRLSALTSLEDVEDVAGALVDALSVTGDLRWLEAEHQALERVDAHDIQDLLNTVLTPAHRTVVHLTGPPGAAP